MTKDTRIFLSHTEIADAIRARDDLFKCSFRDGAREIVATVELRLALETTVNQAVMHAIQHTNPGPHILKAAKDRLVHDFVNKLFKEIDK